MNYASHFLVAGRPSSKPFKRWRLAFAVIYTCRAMQSFTSKDLIKFLHRKPSYVSLSIQLDHPVVDDDDDGDKITGADFSGVNTNVLANLVKNKSSTDLALLGGVQGIVAALASNEITGIFGDAYDLENRKKTFGSNTYLKPKPKRFIRFVLESLNDFFLILLIGCAVLSLAFGIKEHGLKSGWYDGVSIFVAVFLVSSVSAISNYKQDRRFQKLSTEYGNIRVSVVRDSRRTETSQTDVVVGDVVWLKTGDQVPADGVLIEGHSLVIDESSMTGESEHVTVDGTRYPFLTSGVKVADGYGSVLVTAVGMNTTWGQMMSSITRDTNSEPTPLQERLQRLTSAIGKLGMAVAFAVLATLLIRYFTNSNNRKNHSNLASAIVSIVSDAVTIVVVAVPEGLPLAVTLTLAYSMKRMMKDHALVRRLSACETMGSATVVCTDKTGTLTLNEMKVTKFFVDKEEQKTSIPSTIVVDLLRRAIRFNTSGSVYKNSNGVEFSGSPTEKAILSWGVKDLGLDMDAVKSICRVLLVETFNSEKKRSGVLLQDNRTGTKSVHWKGAAEMVLANCSNFINSTGSITEMNQERKRKFEEIITEMAAQSLRCIAFAYRELADSEADHSNEDGEKNFKLVDSELTLLGLIGLKDPCRPEAKLAVKSCRKAGVGVKMITGDNAFTAKAIAIECGIIQSGEEDSDGIVIEGPEFRILTLEERLEIVDKIKVMARSSPFDKLLMVQCLKQKGHVVAVTGDGTNDAPALKEADVGLSMGTQGTEVAKESSDIVILNDNFGTVVTVLRWGRCVFNNIQKFLQFQLTVNVAALLVNFISAVTSGEVPLTTVQLLWVNLIMDTLGALALATEKPTNDVMEKKPIGRTEPLISNIMWRNLLTQAAFQIAVLLTFQYKGESIFGVNQEVKNTILFNTFVLCQIFNEFNARKLEKKNVFRGLHKNGLFMGIIASTLALQVVMVELLNRFANTERLNLIQWSICVGVAVVSWPVGWIAKCVPVSSTPWTDKLILWGQRTRGTSRMA